MADEKTVALVYDNLTPAEKIYSFEFIFAEALRLAFEQDGISSYNMFVLPEFQRDRARVEIVFVPGQGQNIRRKIDYAFRECAWKGEYQLAVITKPDPAEHARYLALIRNFMAGAQSLINDTDMMHYHTIQHFSHDNGTSTRIATEDGYFVTNLNFGIDFSIQGNGWSLIT